MREPNRRSRPGARSLRTPLMLLLALLALSATFLVACGDDDSGSGGSDTGSSTAAADDSGGEASADSGSDGKAAAAAFVEEVAGPKVNVDQKIGKAIPEGVTVDWISCSYETCITLGKYATEAGKELGWNVKYVNGGLTPADAQQAATTVLREKPDYAVIAGLDANNIRSQIKQMSDAGIKVLGFATTPVDGLVGMVRPPRWNINYGKAAASYIIANAEEENPTIGFAVTTEFTAGRQNQQGVKEAKEEFCPDCPYEELEVPATAVGKDAAQRILNWLRGKPDVQWVILSTDAMALGLPPALKSAGLADKVKLVSLFPSEISIPLLKNNQMAVALATNDGASSWDTIDAIARLEVGESAEQPTAANAVPLAVVDPENVGPALPEGPGSWREDFLALWGK